MPLPKPPSKPAALLATTDYPKAEPGKIVKPAIALVDTTRPVRTAGDGPAVLKSKPLAPVTPLPGIVQQPAKPAPASTPRARIADKIVDKAPAEQPRNAAKHSDARAKSHASRSADKRGVTKLFVLDTNVLMHDPTSLFRFEEHDIYLPMITLEELDNHKKGMSEVARNARQISRSLDALV